MVRHYFLGANTSEGFYSLYHEFCPAERGVFLWVIKGGPGCGKSSFMKKIGAAAEETGLDVEYLQCSADPQSLDGVYIPQWREGYVDGTSPHVCEARFPGACSAYLDLGQFYDRAGLTAHADEIQKLNLQYTAAYHEAYAHLKRAKLLHDELEQVYNPHVDFDGVYRLAQAHIDRLRKKED